MKWAILRSIGIWAVLPPRSPGKDGGAGLLADPERIDRILNETFTTLGRDGIDVRLSVKMRPGMDSAYCFPELISILNRYPLSEIILHPRLAARGYQGPVDANCFAEALSTCQHPLTWNGDITSAADVQDIHSRFPQVKRIMIGRGLVTNPALAEVIVNSFQQSNVKASDCPGGQNDRSSKRQQDGNSETRRFHSFHDEVLQGYESYIPDEKGILDRMKELWGWWENTDNISDAAGTSKYIKKIKKAKSLLEYKALVGQLLAEGASQ